MVEEVEEVVHLIIDCTRVMHITQIRLVIGPADKIECQICTLGVVETWVLVAIFSLDLGLESLQSWYWSKISAFIV